MQQVLIVLAMFVSSVLFGQNKQALKKSEGVSIQVTVVNALSDEGTVQFALYNKENFMSSSRLGEQSAAVLDGLSTVSFHNVQPGYYAVLCFHDENANNQMDFDENGMPLESYGSSNNVYHMGPPEFESAKFQVQNQSLKLEIKF